MMMMMKVPGLTPRSPQASLSRRLEKLFQSSFAPPAGPPVEDQVVSLKILLGPPDPQPEPGTEEENRSPGNR